MSDMLHIDLAILGGGCAGLSLAKYLSRIKQWTKKTCIIEARTAYTNDRSWCFWEPQDRHLLNDLNQLILQRWPQWQFSSSEFNTVHQGGARHYCYIPSDRFYQQAIECIDNHSAIELRLGQQVVSVAPENKGYLITLADGTMIYSRQIIDTRPLTYSHSEQSQLWQIFYGAEIKTASPVFDVNRVGLMEDMLSTNEGTQFIYILPFSTNHALIERTLFTKELCSPTLLAPGLHEWLQLKYGKSHFEITRTEQAVLPMGLKTSQLKKQVSPHFSYGGQVAGSIRPATGYAFLRIQRWARHCAKHLAQEKLLPRYSQSSRIVNIMDDIFLTVLQNEPQMGASLFQALAQKVPPAALVRFLSDEATLLDYIAVMRALPTKLFLKYSLNRGQWFNRAKVTS